MVKLSYPKKNWKKVVGLTGGIGSGKSTVLAMCKDLGAFVLAADEIVRQLRQSPAVLAQIRQHFGDDVFNGDVLNSKALAEAVFRHKEDRVALQNIIHPQVQATIANELSNHSGDVAVLDIPLLFETGWDDVFDSILVVHATFDKRLDRLVKRGMNPRQAEARMAAQWPDEKRNEKADFLIDNNSSLDSTRKEVEKFWPQILTTKRGDSHGHSKQPAQPKRPKSKPSK